MTRFISQVHGDIRRTRLTRRGATHRPADVPRGLHKEYPRMPRIVLPAPTAISDSLTAVLEKRHSCRDCGPAALSLQECSTLLGSALKGRGNGADRNYPSGGALYPIETYLITTALEGLAPGIFHYHPTAHALERLWDLPTGFDMKDAVGKPEDLRPTSLLVFTSVWKRSSAKYGDFSYPLALLEAGHMSENIVLISAALGLCACPMAGFEDQVVNKLLDIGETEQAVHSITLGRKADKSGEAERESED